MSAPNQPLRLLVQRVRCQPVITNAHGQTVWRGEDGIQATFAKHLSSTGRVLACSIFFAN